MDLLFSHFPPFLPCCFPGKLVSQKNMPPPHAHLFCKAEPVQSQEDFLRVHSSVAESASETVIQKIILSWAVQHLLNLNATFFDPS